jgi:hypothetical protein
METPWTVDNDGNLDLPVMTGFSVVMLPQGVLAIQIRGAACKAAALAPRRLQVGTSPALARELAATLMEAARRMEDATVVATLN